MKHIKTFESSNSQYVKNDKERKYWVLPTGDKFHDSLKKIGCDDETLTNAKPSSLGDYIIILK